MGKNTLVRSIAPKSVFPAAQGVTPSTLSYEQGDLLCFDATAHAIKHAAAESEGSTFLGVALETVVLGKLKRPYVTDVDASQAPSSTPGPDFGDTHKVVLKTGDTVNPGDLIYLYPAQGTRAVQAAGTKAIGVYVGQVAVTGGPSDQPTEIEALVGARYPLDTLRF